MDKYLRPQVFSVKVNSSENSNLVALEVHLVELLAENRRCTDEVKLDILVSLLDTSVYMYIADCPTF